MCPQNRALHIPLKVSIMCCKVNDILLCWWWWWWCFAPPQLPKSWHLEKESDYLEEGANNKADICIYKSGVVGMARIY
jgi:hypothetical protein